MFFLIQGFIFLYYNCYEKIQFIKKLKKIFQKKNIQKNLEIKISIFINLDMLKNTINIPNN